jgi:hypothetical protein
MMKRTAALLICVLSVGFYTCNTDDLSCERASDNQITRSANLSAFDKVNSTIVADVFLHQAQEHRFEAAGPENVVDALDITVDGDQLLISSKECFTGNYIFTLHLYAPEISEARLSGIGSIRSASGLTAANFSVLLSGVGDIDLQVDADSIYTEITGTGTARLAGNAPLHHVVSTGAAALQAYGLNTDKTFIVSNTPADSYVSVNSELTGSLLGPGSIFYRGSPVVSIDDEGTGQVIDDN